MGPNQDQFLIRKYDYFYGDYDTIQIDIRFLSNLHCRSLKVGFSEYFFIIQK